MSPDSLAKVAISGQGEGNPYPALLMATAALLLAGAVAFAAVVNPRGEFPSDAFEGTVQDELRVKVGQFRGLDAAPETLVLGTSRSANLPVGPADYNFAISGGGLRDDQAVWDFVERSGDLPDRVVLGLDSFQLEARDYALASFEVSGEGAELTGEPRPADHWVRLGLGTLSARYQMDALRTVLRAAEGEPAPSTVAYAPNGVVLRVQADAERANGTYDFDRRFESHWRFFVLGHYPEDARADGTAMEAAVDLVRGIRDAGVDVQVVFTPFHPRALERLEQIEGYNDLEAGLRALVPDLCATGAEVYDYTEIGAFGGDAGDFYDSYHLAPENGRRVLEALDARQGQLCPEAGDA
jgi:hypothetical protein